MTRSNLTPGPSPGPRAVATAVLLAGVALLGGGPASAQRLEKDPVEEFRQALLFDSGKRYDNLSTGEGGKRLLRPDASNSLEVRKRKLRAAANRLTSLSDFSRALLLVEWPPGPRGGGTAFNEYEKQAGEFEVAIRSELVREFRKKTSAALKNTSQTSTRIAAANLVGEALAQTATKPDQRLVLYDDLSPLAEVLIGVLKEQTDASADSLRIAVARSLGQFPSKVRQIAPALKVLLAPRYPVATRQAAADGLFNLALSVSTDQPIRSSEPGITTSEPPPNRPTLEFNEIAELVLDVTDACTAGLADESDAVRRQCIRAIRHASGGLAYEVRLRLLANTGSDLARLLDAPMADAGEEKFRQLELDRINTDLKALDASLKGYAKTRFRVQLNRAVRDADVAARIEARRTLVELARLSQMARALNESLPKGYSPYQQPKKDKGKEDKDLSRGPAKARGAAADGPGAIRLTGGQAAAAPAAPLPRLPQLSARRIAAPPPERKWDLDARSDALMDLLKGIRTGMARDGFRDPDPKARRAAHEAVESLGEAARPLVPYLAESLADRDLFVRWIAARTLRRLAEEDERRNRDPAHPDKVVPALIKGLADEDPDGRTAMTRALGAYGPLARTAVPVLAERLSRGDAEYHIVIIQALDSIGLDSRRALPSVAKALGDPDPRVRVAAANLIGRLPRYSVGYLTDLEKLTDDPDPKVRQNASAAILSIQAARSK